MMIRTLLTATAAIALLAGGAHAGEGKKAAKPAAAAPAAAAPAAASEMGTDSSSQTMSNQPVSADAMSAGADTSATVGNTRVVSNGPVADTPENRAKFPPLSRAGRNTKPHGN